MSAIETLSPRAMTIQAGVSYLLIAVCGGFAIGYLPTQMIAPGDAIQTAQNLIDQAILAKLGIAAEVIVMIAEVWLTALLYTLFKPTDQTISLAAAFARLSMIVIMGVNITLASLALGWVGQAGVTDESARLVQMLLEAKAMGVLIWGLFFALHLALLGWLTVQSGYFPAVFGYMMGFGSLGYVLESLIGMLAIDNGILSAANIAFLTLASIGEIGFALWLVTKGLNRPKWDARHAKSDIAYV